MRGPSTCVDSALEELVRQLNLGYGKEWKQLQIELKLLRTFLIYIPEWSKVDQSVHQRVGDLLIDIGAAFAEAEDDLADAFKEGTKESVNAVYIDLLEKIGSLKARIKEAYNSLSEYSFHSSSPITDFDLWAKFLDSVRSNIIDLPNKDIITRKIKELHPKLSSLHLFIIWMNYESSRKLVYLWTRLGSVVIFAARLSYLCWQHSMDGDEEQDTITTTFLSDSLQRIMPNTPEVIDIYLRAIKAVNLQEYSSSGSREKAFVNFLLPSNVPVETLSEDLVFLVIFMTSTEESTKDVEFIRADITSVLRDVGSFNFTSNTRRETKLALFHLLPKIQIIKAEAFLMELLKNKPPAKLPIEALQQGVISLRTSREQIPEKSVENAELIITHIEAVVADAGSLHLSLHRGEMAEDTVRNVLKLLESVKLLKAELFLMELINRNTTVKDQIRDLHEELEFLRNFVTRTPKEKTNDREIILNRIEAVAMEAISLYQTFHSSQVTEDTVNRVNASVSNLMENIKLVKAQVQDDYLQVRRSSRFNFPKTNGLGFLDFFLQNLRKHFNGKANSTDFLQYQIEVVQKEMEFLQSFLVAIATQLNEHHEWKDLYTRIVDLAYEADYVIDSVLLRNGALCYHMMWLSDVIEELKLISAEVKEINGEKKDTPGAQNVAQTSSHVITWAITPSINKVMVDLKDQAGIIIDRLIGGSSKREIVSIVGMPGIGKTTLARNVYDKPEVEKKFHIRAWCPVSQRPQKSKLLLKILDDIGELPADIQDKSEEDLEDLLHKSLKGKRYLIVMDDIWHIKAWNDLESVFPDDGKGSRILFTSRERELAEYASSYAHPLRLLDDGESWRLLQEMLVHKEDCIKELSEEGKLIAASCKGLPLAIVTIAGVLNGTDRSQESWRKIAENLSSIVMRDPESHCTAILELSYNHLPGDLKPCFLYFGAFLEDKEVSVKKLKWLWRAEGFLRQTEQKNLEEIAEDYLMDLIGRSLVMVVERRSDGGVKSCRIHDLLRSLCQSKANEENFFQTITGYGEHFPASSVHLDYDVDSNFDFASNRITHDEHRISISSKRNHFVMLRPSGPRVRSLLFFALSDRNPSCPYDVSFIPDNFKLLRVLELESINMGISFPTGIELLLQLRYLALRGLINSVPSSIAQLRNLETFIVKGMKGKVELPDAIWSMESLRHLHVNSIAAFQMLKSPSQLHNLETLSSPSISLGKDAIEMLKRLLGLRKLQCVLSESWNDPGKCSSFPNLNFLEKLESLKILYNGGVWESCELNFPSNLTKLTLSDFHLPWDCISAIGELRNLEVLKLLSGAFDGKTWEMKDGQFENLKFLKLDSLDLVEWKAKKGHLAKLESLILRRCKKLVEIPSVLGGVYKLQMIKVHWCNSSIEELVKGIQDAQKDLSNDDLKVIINLPGGDSGSLS